MKIPFSWTPTAWAMKGDTRKRAEAEYNFTGETLERVLLDIDYPNDNDDRAKKLLDVENKYGYITPYAFDLGLARINIKDDVDFAKAELDIEKNYDMVSSRDYEMKVAQLTLTDDDLKRAELKIMRNYDDISEEDYNRQITELNFSGDELILENMYLDFKEGKITEKEYSKRIATTKGEAWVDGSIKLDGTGKSFVEIDWNEMFIEGLRDKGYTGLTDEEIIEMWWTNVNMHDIENHAEPITRTTTLGNGKSEVT